MVKAAIFDLGGTLMSFGGDGSGLNFFQMEHQGLGALHDHLVAGGLSLPLRRDDFRDHVSSRFEDAWTLSLSSLVGNRVDKVLRQLLDDWELPLSDEALRQAILSYHRAMEPHIGLYDDTVETLEICQARGLAIGLISNTLWLPEMHDADLGRLGIDGFFDHKIYSSDHAHLKPHGAIFSDSLAALGIAPSEAVFVGDRIIDDVGGAQGAGMLGVLKTPPDRDETHDTIVADLVITELADLWETVLT
jgi:putative hydrolase of the HAD superfamily